MLAFLVFFTELVIEMACLGGRRLLRFLRSSAVEVFKAWLVFLA